MRRSQIKHYAKSMQRYRGSHPDEVRRVAKQYGYESGCIVPGCNLPARIHHIVPRREGGTNGLHNLMPICYDHEVKIHKAGAVARAMDRRPDLDVLAWASMPRAIRKRLLKNEGDRSRD